MIHDAEEFVRLRSSEDPAEYQRAANDPAETATWMEIVYGFPEMRVWVAHNKTVPVQVLDVLLQDHNPEVRAAVAMKNKLSPEVLALLAQDVSDFVRERVAYNKNTPMDVLRVLSRDKCSSVAAQAQSRLEVAEGKSRA